ncbi:hypothetical protein FRC96_06985 [Lujinxingia vulgaris]|uniref:Uncharacterized protein n=1 Tax=Lujinxingia vulgaris TaxID=2600176 RepID=A0A5C6XDV5_9DELT|nr:hypothetical protein [Lujinxingia vulgaris]TXD39596.1 hypothetical protein FRC96_06985 [Lujinxingia vulgaris]
MKPYARLGPALSLVIKIEALEKLRVCSPQTFDHLYENLFDETKDLIIFSPFFALDHVTAHLANCGLRQDQDYVTIAHSGGLLPAWCDIYLGLSSGDYEPDPIHIFAANILVVYHPDLESILSKADLAAISPDISQMVCGNLRVIGSPHSLAQLEDVLVQRGLTYFVDYFDVKESKGGEPREIQVPEWCQIYLSRC